MNFAMISLLVSMSWIGFAKAEAVNVRCECGNWYDYGPKYGPVWQTKGKVSFAASFDDNKYMLEGKAEKLCRKKFRKPAIEAANCKYLNSAALQSTADLNSSPSATRRSTPCDNGGTKECTDYLTELENKIKSLPIPSPAIARPKRNENASSRAEENLRETEARNRAEALRRFCEENRDKEFCK